MPDQAMPEIDFAKALELQQGIAEAFSGANLCDCMLVLQNEIANIILLHGVDQDVAMRGVDAVCGDIKKIIAARFMEALAKADLIDTGARH